jgi:hypothetical protein
MTTSLLSPAYELTLGRQIWKQQAIEISVDLSCAPRVDRLSVRLPAAAPLSAKAGDEASLILDSGEQKETVFTGTIDCIRRTFEDIRIVALNAGSAMSRVRPAATYEQISAGKVIRNLAGDAGVTVGSVEDGTDLTFYVADPSRTAWEHVARLSAWGGALARVSKDNEIECKPVNATQAELALLHGREVLWMQSDSFESTVDGWTVAGEGGAGSASAPEALRSSTDFFAGNRPQGPGTGQRWQFHPALRTATAAGTAGAALKRQYDSSRDSGCIRAFLQPKFRCGTVFEVQQLPDGFPGGPLWVSGVSHTLGSGGGYTTARFCKGGDSFDPFALLGSLAAALF